MQMSRIVQNVMAFVLFSLALSAASLPFVFQKKAPPPSLVPETTEQADVTKVLEKLNAAERQRLSQIQIDSYHKDPLSLLALQNLAVLRELDSKKPESEAIALALAHFSRRSVTSQLAAAQIDFAEKRYETAFSRLDGVFRAQPELVKVLIPSLVPVLQNDEPRKYFAAVLAPEPPWRGSILYELGQLDTSGALTYRLLKEIYKANGKILDSEKRSLIWKYAGAKQYSEAYFIWLELLSPDELLKVQNVFDPGFTQEPKTMFFDWNLAVRKSARIQIMNRPGKSGDTMLSMDFYDDREGGPYVYQYLQLSEGRYELTFESQIDSMQNEKGLVWRVRCLETGLEIAKTSAIREKGPWEKLGIEFSVPAADCSSQSLALENASNAILDQVISAKIAFDNVLIQRREPN
jgi:tetratricopeptide (TPR) repeat protein